MFDSGEWLVIPRYWGFEAGVSDSTCNLTLTNPLSLLSLLPRDRPHHEPRRPNVQPSFDFVYRVTLHLAGFKVRDKYSAAHEGAEIDELWPSTDQIIEFDEDEEFYQSKLTSPTLVSVLLQFE